MAVPGERASNAFDGGYLEIGPNNSNNQQPKRENWVESVQRRAV